MNTHKIKLEGYQPRLCQSAPLILGTAGSRNTESLQVILGTGWQDLTIKVIFHPCKVTCILPSTGLLTVPWEATAEPLNSTNGRIVFQGFNHEKLINSMDIAYHVVGHSSTVGREDLRYTPSAIEQVIQQMKSDKADIITAAHQAQHAMTIAVDNAQTSDNAIKIISEAQKSIEEARDQALASEETSVTNAAASVKILEQVQSASIQSVEEIKNASTMSINAIQNSSDTAIAHLENAESEALTNIANAAPLLPSVSTEFAGQAVTVSSDGSTYNLAGPYTPIAAAIRPIVHGNPAVCQNSISWNLQGLSIYGKSSQEREPSPENPTPIVFVGQSGNITLNIAGDEGQSQTLHISTPDGLYGISVENNGNYIESNGSQWICDEINFDRNIYIKNLFFKTISDNDIDQMLIHIGQPSGGWYNSGETLSCFGYYEDNPLFPIPKYANCPCLCNILSSTQNLVWTDKVGISFESQSYFIFRFAKAELKQFGWKDETDSNESISVIKRYMKCFENITIVYPIQPLEIPLSKAQLAAYHAIHAYNGTTTITSSNDSPMLRVRYVADSEKLFDSIHKRLTALESEQQ